MRTQAFRAFPGALRRADEVYDNGIVFSTSFTLAVYHPNESCMKTLFDDAYVMILTRRSSCHGRRVGKVTHACINPSWFQVYLE
jgi:hypothetical protein